MLGTPTIYFDVDDTLLIWNLEGKSICNDKLPGSIKVNCYDKEYWVLPHEKHIESLKTHKNEGFKIVVWSAGGEEWAQEAVYTLNLQNYVDVCLSKPDFYYDDLPAESFLHHTKRIYHPYKKQEDVILVDTNSGVSLEQLVTYSRKLND